MSGPPVASWFITPISYSYKYHTPYWSCKPNRLGAPYCNYGYQLRSGGSSHTHPNQLKKDGPAGGVLAQISHWHPLTMSFALVSGWFIGMTNDCHTLHGTKLIGQALTRVLLAHRGHRNWVPGYPSQPDGQHWKWENQWPVPSWDPNDRGKMSTPPCSAVHRTWLKKNISTLLDSFGYLGLTGASLFGDCSSTRLPTSAQVVMGSRSAASSVETAEPLWPWRHEQRATFHSAPEDSRVESFSFWELPKTYIYICMYVCIYVYI